MMEPLFHEIYGTYFIIVSEILKHQQPLTTNELNQIITRHGFAESTLQVLPSIQNKKNPWYLLTEEDTNNWRPITKHRPPQIQTNIERRWLKTLLTDPRLFYFLEDCDIATLDQQLANVQPLFDLATLTYYDQFNQIDAFVEQQQQQIHFKQLLHAIQKQQAVKIDYQRRADIPSKRGLFLPIKLDYSAKNNLFRLKAWRILRQSRFEVTLNLNRMLTIQPVEKERDYLKLPITSRKQQAIVTCLLTDKRQALTRSMLHFADYHKATRRLDNRHYELTIHYDNGDETELLIRILSFGPFLKVLSPDSFVAKIKVRIDAQAQIMANFKLSNEIIE
ncbi:WYL domain-containing protein [Enterococcus sp. LJL99]